MRPLTSDEISSVSGAETIVYTLPVGSTVTTKLEGNSSTTININVPGFGGYSWNSGTYLTCFLIGSGFGITAGILSRNLAVGALTQRLVSWGCKMVVDNIDTPQTNDDGDG
ncbi:hypothetical protein [Pandoraea pneumonica]|jgi:hypothetical protein|uniref:hypothetical protein n=1 Tax=Pandoraea pneumonica TaxID=2508299 RepID=UPI001242A9AC|nr:hypothetical protein [Pandoraea pneumonica]